MPVARASFDVFTAVADPTRRAMLELLLPSGVERSAGELGRPFAAAQPTISQHLRVLRESGVVSVREAGRHRLYRLEPEPLKPVQTWIDRMLAFEDPAGHVWEIKPKPKES